MASESEIGRWKVARDRNPRRVMRRLRNDLTIPGAVMSPAADTFRASGGAYEGGGELDYHSCGGGGDGGDRFIVTVENKRTSVAESLGNFRGFLNLTVSKIRAPSRTLFANLWRSCSDKHTYSFVLGLIIGVALMGSCMNFLTILTDKDNYAFLNYTLQVILKYQGEETLMGSEKPRPSYFEALVNGINEANPFLQ